MKSVVVDPSAYDWEGDAPLRQPSSRTIIYEMHVRGFTRHPSSGVAEKTRGHVCRADREDSVSPGARHHRGRAAAGVPVRRPGLPAGHGQLLGLRAGLVLRAAPGLQLAAGSARPGRRVPRHGQGAAPRGHRGHSRRRLQPHGRRRPHRADALLPRPRQRRRTTSSKRTARATPTTPARGNTLNANHPIVRRMIVDSLRYWVEEMHVDGFRFDLASILARDPSGQSDARTRRCCGTSNPIPRSPARSSSPKPGTPPACTRSAASSATAGRNGTAASATMSASFFRGETGSVSARRRPAARQPRDLRTRRARGRAERQLRHLPRRLHAQRSGLLQPQAQRGERRRQPRRHQRQPELELRRRRADRRSGDREAAQPAGEELPDRHAALARHADDPDGRRGPAHPARQQQRLLPGQRDQLVRLDAAGEARGRAPVRDAAHRRRRVETWRSSAAA